MNYNAVYNSNDTRWWTWMRSTSKNNNNIIYIAQYPANTACSARFDWYCDMDKGIMDVSELLMVTGCIAKKRESKSCKANLGSVSKPVKKFWKKKSVNIVNNAKPHKYYNSVIIYIMYNYSNKNNIHFNVCRYSG